MRTCTPIIDAHCHTGAGSGFGGPWDTDAPLEPHLRRSRACGIVHTVVWPAFHDDYEVANRRLATIVSRDRTRLTGVAFVHADRDRGRILSMVAPLVERHGFRGIKCHRHDARISREVCEAARRLSVPIVYDPMGENSAVELAAQQYPDVTLIIPHLSSFADDWHAQRTFLDILERRPNVLTDTSGVRRFDLLVEAIRRAGPTKVLFGSDGPWLHPSVEFEKVRVLGLRPRDFGLIAYENARRVFGLRLCPLAPQLQGSFRHAEGLSGLPL
jgi:predicted TIM-barrel fold metal-dependent hydrolase